MGTVFWRLGKLEQALTNFDTFSSVLEIIGEAVVF